MSSRRFRRLWIIKLAGIGLAGLLVADDPQETAVRCALPEGVTIGFNDATRVCIQTYSQAIAMARPGAVEFASELVNELLADPAQGNDTPAGPIDFVELGQLVAQLGTREPVKHTLIYLGAREGWENEALAAGVLYPWQPKQVLRQLSTMDAHLQEQAVFKIAFGVVSFHWGLISVENYERVIVGTHWHLEEELQSAEAKLHDKIKAEVRKLLDLR